MTDSQIPKKVEVLLQKINESFADTTYPGDSNIVYDNTGYHIECNEVAAAFRGKSWDEVPLDVLRYNHEGLFFFTVQGYRYYLPAYLRATVQFYDEAGNIPGTVIFSLSPPATEEPKMDEFHSKMEGFEPNQKRVIKEFLDFIVEFHGSDFANKLPEIALDRFWRNLKS